MSQLHPSPTTNAVLSARVTLYSTERQEYLISTHVVQIARREGTTHSITYHHQPTLPSHMHILVVVPLSSWAYFGCAPSKLFIRFRAILRSSSSPPPHTGCSGGLFKGEGHRESPSITMCPWLINEEHKFTTLDFLKLLLSSCGLLGNQLSVHDPFNSIVSVFMLMSSGGALEWMMSWPR